MTWTPAVPAGSPLRQDDAGSRKSAHRRRFALDNFLLGLSSGIPGLYTVMPVAPSHPTGTPERVSRHCQETPRGKGARAEPAAIWEVGTQQEVRAKRE